MLKQDIGIFIGLDGIGIQNSMLCIFDSRIIQHRKKLY